MIKLPKQALDASKKYLPEYYYTNLPNIALATRSLNGGQLQYVLTHESNKSLYQDGYQEISAYTMFNEPPIITPNFAVYHISELYQHVGPLVYLDFESFDFGWSSFHKNTAFYIYDVNLINYLPQFIKDNLRKYKGKIITRSKEHARYLYTLTGVNCNHFVKEVNIEEFRKILNG